MTEETTSKRSKRAAAERPSHVLIDYKGICARPRELATRLAPDMADRLGKRQVQHTMSPIYQAWPEAGRMSLAVHPGFNRVDRETWEFYAKNSKQIRDLVNRREIKVLAERPDDLIDIIDRSYCHESLQWLREQLASAEDEGADAAEAEEIKAQRKYAIQAIDERLATTRQVRLGTTAWSAPPVYVPGAARPTAHGMG